ncbi:hypothetical protein RIF29_16254 [Crotalaria pallida]|uniref:Uncharacterized protein n=1 Tax=Crotalaria pallida TaxID=3830 RepID=A0AAN9FKP4_CROPI
MVVPLRVMGLGSRMMREEKEARIGSLRGVHGGGSEVRISASALRCSSPSAMARNGDGHPKENSVESLLKEILLM